MYAFDVHNTDHTSLLNRLCHVATRTFDRDHAYFSDIPHDVARIFDALGDAPATELVADWIVTPMGTHLVMDGDSLDVSGTLQATGWRDPALFKLTVRRSTYGNVATYVMPQPRPDLVTSA